MVELYLRFQIVHPNYICLWCECTVLSAPSFTFRRMPCMWSTIYRPLSASTYKSSSCWKVNFIKSKLNNCCNRCVYMYKYIRPNLFIPSTRLVLFVHCVLLLLVCLHLVFSYLWCSLCSVFHSKTHTQEIQIQFQFQFCSVRREKHTVFGSFRNSIPHTFWYNSLLIYLLAYCYVMCVSNIVCSSFRACFQCKSWKQIRNYRSTFLKAIYCKIWFPLDNQIHF